MRTIGSTRAFRTPIGVALLALACVGAFTSVGCSGLTTEGLGEGTIDGGGDTSSGADSIFNPEDTHVDTKGDTNGVDVVDTGLVVDTGVTTDTGVVTDTGTGVDTCPSGTTGCPGGCFDTTKDDAHCGACGTACGGGQHCVSSVCTCPSPQIFCGGACIDPTHDPSNCGSCGNVCATFASCASSACACPDTFDITCGGTPGTCVDPQEDPFHCGGCGTACRADMGCDPSAGPGCVCHQGTTNCGGSGCIDERGDHAHCGDCSSGCSTGQTCSDGSCTGGSGCPGGRTNCSNSCWDLANDETHCGTSCATMKACAAGEICIGGACLKYAPALGCATGGSCDCAKYLPGVSPTHICPALAGGTNQYCVEGGACPKKLQGT
jgi:hypothetical protein